MSDFVVLGGNGFIGSHVVDALRFRGHSVTVFDRFGGAPYRWDSNGVDVIDGDFFNPSDVACAVRGRQNVVHMLSTTDPASAAADPGFDMSTNVLGTVALLQACVAGGVGCVHYVSSGGAIYGATHGLPSQEGDPTEPVSPYAIGKQAIESYLRFFRATYGLESVIYRVSNPYGTRQNPAKHQGLIPIMLRAALRNEPITVMGDGSMTRDFIFVEDVAEIMSMMMTEGTRHHLYNVGSGVSTSVMDVLRVVESLVGHPLATRRVPNPPSFVQHVRLDVTRLYSEFPASPRTPLADGIKRTWEEFQRTLV